MPTASSLKPTHKVVAAYYQTLEQYSDQRVEHELAVRSAFQNLLAETAKAHGWMLIPELVKKVAGHSLRPDGTLRDTNSLPRGYWEAKDSSDDLDAEIRKKTKLGYPLTNTIFEDTRTAVLFQNKREAIRVPLADRQQLCNLLNLFYSHTEPDFESFEQAVEEFKDRVPELGRGLAVKIADAHRDNSRFQKAFDTFFQLCQTALNPNIRREAVDEMLVQHILTERLIRTIFHKDDFTRQNVIAAEVENVIDALVQGKSFSRQDYLRSLDPFYVAIENAARNLEDFGDKQHLLNTVYERFFQGFSVKAADTMGIVYTPQPVVDFMCASVAEVLEKEFGKTLGSADVNILDPCTGTGNFIVNLLGRIPKRDLPRMYGKQLFANEVMLMPYYIAALNIEHAYSELTGDYEAFEGLCFVDTLDLAEGSQRLLSYMTEKNTERVARQKRAPITVIIGNPPYNIGQQDENDRNRNRKYEVIDPRISETYIKDSSATLRMQLYDPYVRFFRWATDRLQGRDGIVCFISNNAFLTGRATDGFRKHLQKDFDLIYHFDFKGNARTTSERRRREGGNIFSDQIRVGVGISVLVRAKGKRDRQILHHAVEDYGKAEEKKQYLASLESLSAVPWKRLTPDSKNNWLVPEHAGEFESFVAIGSKQARIESDSNAQAIFKVYSAGVKTNADSYLYDFNRSTLVQRAWEMVENFNSELDRWKRHGEPEDLDGFLKVDPRIHKWIRNTKRTLLRGKHIQFDESRIRLGLDRPYSKRFYFFERAFNEDTYRLPKFLPTDKSEAENAIICSTNHAQTPFLVQITNCIPNEGVGGRAGQCFPFYVYAEDGGKRRENITDWALEQFRAQYKDKKISKWDIFYYVYGLLHHRGYCTKFADNLKRELPRIPFAPAGAKNGFRAFANAGKQLAELHLNYEQLEPYPLQFLETSGVPLSYRVADKMRLSKDKSGLTINPSLTLAGIPPETFDYRLGNRSALEWVIDQYQVSTDKRSGIQSDPNRPDDEEYIVRLVGQVVRVSVETVRIVSALPANFTA